MVTSNLKTGASYCYQFVPDHYLKQVWKKMKVPEPFSREHDLAQQWPGHQLLEP